MKNQFGRHAPSVYFLLSMLGKKKKKFREKKKEKGENKVEIQHLLFCRIDTKDISKSVPFWPNSEIPIQKIPCFFWYIFWAVF